MILDDIAGMLPAWFDQAACVDAGPDAFFPEKGQDATAALAICGRCPVRGRCADYALEQGFTDGVFGGMTPKDRKAGRRRAA